MITVGKRPLARILVAALFTVVATGQLVHNALTLHIRCQAHDQVHDVQLAGGDTGSSAGEARSQSHTSDDGHRFCLSAVFVRARATVSARAFNGPPAFTAQLTTKPALEPRSVAVYRYAPAHSPPA